MRGTSQNVTTKQLCVPLLGGCSSVANHCFQQNSERNNLNWTQWEGSGSVYWWGAWSRLQLRSSLSELKGFSGPETQMFLGGRQGLNWGCWGTTVVLGSWSTSFILKGSIVRPTGLLPYQLHQTFYCSWSSLLSADVALIFFNSIV